ncbi:MAG: nucleotidyltransferase [Saprospiraceae bacterium]|nr:nucleotidyltransferase [Saprospiraceae bacterium]
MKPTLLILAAGIGSRYGGLKQVDGVGPNGEAIIEYSIYDAIRAGFGKVVFIIRQDIEAAFKEKFGGKFDHLIETGYVFQELDSPIEGISEWPERIKPWGTGHAMLVAANAINEPFAVINADDYYGVDAFREICVFLQNDCTPNHYGMVGYVLSNTLSDHGTVSRGVCSMDEASYLTDINERTKVERTDKGIFYEDTDGRHLLGPDTLVSMNFWGFHPSVFETARQLFVQFVKDNANNPKAEFFIPLIVSHQIKAGEIKLKVIPCNDQWYGVTYQEDKAPVKAAFREFIDQGIYPEALWG